MHRPSCLPRALALLVLLAPAGRAAQLSGPSRAALPPLFAPAPYAWSKALAGLGETLGRPYYSAFRQGAPMLGFLSSVDPATEAGRLAVDPLVEQLAQGRKVLITEVLAFEALPLSRRWTVLKEVSDAHNDATFEVARKALHAVEVAESTDDPLLLQGIKSQLKGLVHYGEQAQRAYARVDALHAAALSGRAEALAEVLTAGRSRLSDDGLVPDAASADGDLAAAAGSAQAREAARLKPRADADPEREVLFDSSIEVLGLSNRAANALRGADIRTVREVVERSADDVLRVKNLGLRSLRDIEQRLAAHGLALRGQQAPAEAVEEPVRDIETVSPWAAASLVEAPEAAADPSAGEREPSRQTAGLQDEAASAAVEPGDEDDEDPFNAREKRVIAGLFAFGGFLLGGIAAWVVPAALSANYAAVAMGIAAALMAGFMFWSAASFWRWARDSSGS